MARFCKTKRLELDSLLPDLIENQKIQQWRAAEILGVSRDWVVAACNRLNLRTQRTGPRSGSGHPEWRGGRQKYGRYYYIYAPDHPFCTKHHCVAEHRLVMEEVLGRYLLPTEVVHHKNGAPDDNRPENLEVFSTNAEHLKHELTGRVPKWTPQGKARIREAVRRTNKNRRLKSCGHQRTRSSPR